MASNSNNVSDMNLSNGGGGASNSATDLDAIYALPKVYNGKTVTDLFPEFKYDTVLRFSKLFGLGKTSSLPKIWKGTRKRKKNKNDPPDLNRQQTQLERSDMNDESERAPEADDKAKSVVQDLVVSLEEFEFEPDDEVQLKKPLVIEKLKNKSAKSSAESQLEEALAKSEIPDEVLYGPASYWYQQSEYADLARSALKEKILNKMGGKPSAAASGEYDERKKNEEDEPPEKMNGEDDEAGGSNNECETICLGEAIDKLADSIKDEAYLLINTLNWEESIILDPAKTCIPTESAGPAAVTTGGQQQAVAVAGSSLNAKVVDKINERVKYAGWVASAEHPNLYSFQSRVLGKKLDLAKLKELQQSIYGTTATTTATNSKQAASNQGQSLANFSSIFPNENYEFIYGDWENQVVLDPKDTNLHEMREYFIDLNDENILLDLAEPLRDADDKENETGGDKASGQSSGQLGKHKEKGKTGEGKLKPGRHPIGRPKDDGEDNEKENKANEDDKNVGQEGKNCWNLSNDDYYNPKIIAEPTATVASKAVSTALVIQHTLAAVELKKPYFPTNLSSFKLRHFHRYALKRATPGFQPVNTFNTKMALTFNTANLNKQKDKKDQPAVVAKDDIMRNVSLLTAADCSEIILAEYSEQYPPLMMQPSMVSKIRSYYKKRFAKDEHPDKNLEYGEIIHVNSTPFLGTLKQGECLQALENYMFRAPIYQHKVCPSDFLVIRTKHLGYVIRGDIKCLFVVGQECPLIEVPGPNSKRANSFIKDFLQAYIFRLFHRSDEAPKCVRMEDIKAAFPNLAENSIRKRLKIFADFKRATTNSNLWYLREDVRLPSEEEIRTIITPEQVCAYYSMLAAEQRLKDAGYGEKNLFASDDEDMDNMKIDDEVKNAPWHTTRAYLDAVKGKCLLQINGVADPTGRGEGFSYVRQPFKKNEKEGETGADQAQQAAGAGMNESTSSPMPTATPAATAAAAAASSSNPSVPKRTVTGTDADLRRLHLSQAKELLSKYGVPDEEIKKLKRWEIIDVVRTMSTQKARESNSSDVSKFARGGTKYSQSDAHEKYREECQRLFELQNRNLASEEYLSTDEDESSEQDTDVDEMGKNLESMLSSRMGAATDAKSAANEVAGSQDTKQQNGDADENKSSSANNINSNKNRVLRITRTYLDEETGQPYTKVEVVKKQPVIDAYVKIRSTKDDEYIRTAFSLDETEKEKLRKEKRRLQEQLRRVKRVEAKRASEAKSAARQQAKAAKKLGLTPKIPKAKMPGVRKTPKEPGVKKMTKKARLAAEAAGLLNLSLGEDNSMLNMSDRLRANNMSSCDENSFMNELTLNKLNSSASINLNDTQDPNAPPLVKPKRKYQKRKKPNETADGSILNTTTNATAAAAADDSTMNNTTLSLSKVEGTKLIIQKKAIKMAMADESSLGGGDSSKPKTPKITKKALKLMTQMGTGADPSNASSLPPFDKSPSKKEKPSLILHIPKEKIGMPKSYSSTAGSSNLKMAGPSTSDSGTSSPAVDVTSVSDPMSAVPSLMAMAKQNRMTPQQPSGSGQPMVKEKRPYNKQNSMTKKQQRQIMDEQAAVAAAVANQHSTQQMVNQLSSLLPFSPFLTDPNQAAAAFLSQALFSPNAFGLPTTPDAAAAAAFVSLFQSPAQSQQQQQQPQSQQQQQQQAQPPQRKKSTTSSNQQLDYLTKPPKKVDRRHTDPLVSFATILEGILNELRDKEEAQPFLIPVNPKKVPDYFMIIKKPIDLQMIRKRINDNYYKNRTSFLEDMNMLVQNSILYNGKEHQITYAAERLFSACTDMFHEKESELVRWEKAINPLLDDSLIAFNYILDQIFEQQIMTVDNSFSFLKPVNKAKYKDYYELIRNPIDLERIKSRITTKKYRSRVQFIGDFELLFNNSLKYNGPSNIYTNTAAKLLEACKNACEYDYNDQLGPLEDNLAYGQQQRELEEAKKMSHDHAGSGPSSTNQLVRTNSFSKGPNPNTSSSSNSNSMMMMMNNQQQQQIKKKLKPNPPKTPITPAGFNPSGPSTSGINRPPNKVPVDKPPQKFNQKQQQNLLFNPVSNQNSPKSASDAEVFVDVESIDDVKSVAAHRLSKMLYEPTKYHQQNAADNSDDQMDF